MRHWVTIIMARGPASTEYIFLGFDHRCYSLAERMALLYAGSALNVDSWIWTIHLN